MRERERERERERGGDERESVCVLNLVRYSEPLYFYKCTAVG